MCGIVGLIPKNKHEFDFRLIHDALKTLDNRGPDDSGVFEDDNCALGHARLAIIDTSSAAKQPFTDESGRYILVFNGEIYNYKSLQQILKNKSYNFKTHSDTEVLLYWLIEYGSEGIKDLNGFFAFCFYDSLNKEFLFARDRFGIKPLLIYEDGDFLAFASEFKALNALQIPKSIDVDSLHLYFKFNYIPQPYSMVQGVQKLQAGTFAKYNAANGKLISKEYYSLNPADFGKSDLSYENAQKQLREILEESVQKRLLSDVPLGAFLSGGIDSSVIVALASKHVPKLSTFSIGYKDEPLFDETSYAELVAKKFNTDHTVFKLSNQDLYEQLYKVLDYTDEPFADSSGLAVNILCEKTKQKASVALSGDGADEIFSGYHKHQALFLAAQNNVKNSLISAGRPLWSLLPQSRNSKMGNLARKLQKFSNGLRLNQQERYWLWAGYLKEMELNTLIKSETSDFLKRKNNILKHVDDASDFNTLLYTDLNLVLSGDMLQKVDLNSMAHSLEVRVPFLDHNVVNFAFSLPVEYKINAGSKKRILQDAFRDILPSELYNRPKHGFEVPLLKWFKTDLKSKIFEEYLAEDFIEAQGIFHYPFILKLQQQLFSNSPGDATATIWALIVFQHWYKNVFAD